MRLVCTSNGPIQCELQTFSLDDKPEYKALSYCWTQAAAICKIFVNGVPFFIRPNLSNYLELRNKDRDTGWVFIDAICIDQRDVEERSSQVQLMGDVYGSATEVIVWLGKEDRWQDLIAQRGHRGVSMIKQHCEGSSKIDFRELDNAAHRALVWSAFRMAFLLPEYWLRAWIVQEVRLARTLVFKYQNLELDLDSFENFLSLFHGQGLSDVRNAGNSSSGRAWVMLDYDAGGDFFGYDRRLDKNLMALRIARSITSSRHQEQTAGFAISSTVIAYGAQMCSVWHDIVYAFLGLTGSDLAANYSLSRIELYAAVLIEGTLEVFRPPGSHGDSAIHATFNHFVVAICQALRLDPRHATVALLTQRVMKNCGVERTTFHFREVIESFDTLQVQGAGLKIFERVRRTDRMLRKTQRRVTGYRLMPCLYMPVLNTEHPKSTFWMEHMGGQLM